MLDNMCKELKKVKKRLSYNSTHDYYNSINITNDIYTHTFESIKMECAIAFDCIMKISTKITKNT